jgi:ABC-2 type transport system ATP-binding protein
MTVGYLLGYLKSFYSNWDDARAAELVKMFRLPLDRKFRNLSRGMKMKASLASLMAFHPKLLILDEPFSGLDPLTRDELIQGLLDSAPETTVVLSSHDLAEIESFVSHVAYLDHGQLAFSEELSTLTARFREITVTLEQPAEPDPWPPHWICSDRGTSCVRFVETRFDAGRTDEEISVLFSGVTHVETTAMPLRSIFLALARTDSRAD